jgi:predicted YcjX-like family ATPase
MRWLSWRRKNEDRRLTVVREWQRAERQQRAEYDAAVRRIIDSTPNWNAPTAPYSIAPLMTRLQGARSQHGGPW